MFTYAKPEQKQASKDTVQKKISEESVLSPNMTGIPDGMKSRFGNLSHFSFNDMRVHYNSGKPVQLQAFSYAQVGQPLSPEIKCNTNKIVQMRPNPNTLSGPNTFQSSISGPYNNVSYMRDGNAAIDFSRPQQGYVSWQDPIDTTVDLSEEGNGIDTGKKHDGSVIAIRGASRGDHFNIANELIGEPGSASPPNLTWHHLVPFPMMALVDRTVHQKYAHVGGFELW